MSTCFWISVVLIVQLTTAALHGGGKEVEDGGSVPAPMPAKHGTAVTKDQRRIVVSTELGEISRVKVSDGRDGFYDLQFITMEPNSLLVPVHLHSDMVFYVNSGSGTLSWVDLENDKLQQVDLRTGDVYRLRTGSFFYLQSNLDSDRRKLRINAIFSDSKEEIREGSSFGAYSSVADLLLGFDDKVLQAALNVDEGVIQELKSGGRQALIVPGVSKVDQLFQVQYRSLRAFLGLIDNGMVEVNKNKKDKKGEAYNILEAKHDFENCNGWSLIVTSKQTDVFKDSDFGVFMVNLTKGSMMGPHWNPLTAEIAVVLSGRGMVHVVCPSSVDEAECKNTRFRVEEGDVFVVPRYHPMVQISFNNGSFVFVGFTTTQKNNHPQYLVGSASVFQVLDKRVLAASFGVSNITLDEMLSAQQEAIILECTSCAEEEERLLEEEIQRQKEEEEAQKREEEERKREEEEARKREEEEEARREEEEARKREEEEEARREEEEARKREEEEEARREEEEARKREEEEEARREEEEARKREEEEEARREEEARKREEEEEARREEEEARKREEEEEARREEEEARKREEEEAARREEEEEARREEEEARKREEEEEARREEDEARKREEEEAARREEEEEARREQEGKRRHEEEEAARQQEEEAATKRRQQEEEAAEEQEMEAERRIHEEEELARQRREQEEAERRQQEQEEAARRQQEQEAARRQQQEEEAARRQQDKAMRRKQEKEARRHEEEEEEVRRRVGQQEEGEGEAARRQEEEMAQRAREAEEEAGRRREAGGGNIYNPQRM